MKSNHALVINNENMNVFHFYFLIVESQNVNRIDSKLLKILLLIVSMAYNVIVA